jgi:hypothetical protein
MALTTRFTIAIRNARCQDIGTKCNNGYIRIYSGSQPSDPDQAPGGTLLATLRFANPAFGSPVNGQITANAITPDSSAAATGTATWARILQSDGTTVVMDVSVGTTGSNINLNSVDIKAGGQVAISAWVHTEPLTEGT